MFKYVNELRLTNKAYFEKKLKIFFDIFNKCNKELHSQYNNPLLNIKEEYNSILKQVFSFFNKSKTTFELTLNHNTLEKILAINKWKKEVKEIIKSIVSANIELTRVIRKDSIRIHITPSNSVLKSSVRSKIKTQMKRFLLLVNSIKDHKAMRENMSELKSYINSISRLLDSNDKSKIIIKTESKAQSINEPPIIQEKVKEEQIEEPYIEMIEGEMKKEESIYKKPVTFIITRVYITLSIGK